MSALTLDPQIKNAPKYLHRFYHGYTPELYKEICDFYRNCPSIDVKRKTALKYAKLAQERDLENKVSEERSKYRGYEFINFDGLAKGVFRDQDVFVNEFKRHIQALLLRLGHVYHYAADEVKILVRGYDPYNNRMNTILKSWDYTSMAREIARGTAMTAEDYARSVWQALMKNDTQNIQKRTIRGWSVFGNNNEKTLYFIDFSYDQNLDKLVDAENERRNNAELMKNQSPDAMGYGGRSGRYTGD